MLILTENNRDNWFEYLPHTNNTRNNPAVQIDKQCFIAKNQSFSNKVIFWLFRVAHWLLPSQSELHSLETIEDVTNTIFSETEKEVKKSKRLHAGA